MSNSRQIVDLRSDTITKPTPGMLEAMFSAEVGDDVFDEDPTVNALQDRLAKMFGMEAAMFCASGTMSNQIAIRVSTQPQDEIICDRRSHIYLYEGGGIAANSLCSVRLLDGDRGCITAEMVSRNINPDDIHNAQTAMVSIENTMNKGGGSIYTLEEVKKISKVCREKELKFHMDGARFFNALAETGETPGDYGALFDTISICFSKGLGAPVGSVLLGSHMAIKKALRVRKSMGGGMRQVGYLAAACNYSLDHHVGRLKEDHLRAKRIGEILQENHHVKSLFPVDTNIVIAQLDGILPEEFVKQLSEQGVLGLKFGEDAVRFVTHLDFDDDGLSRFADAMKKI